MPSLKLKDIDPDLARRLMLLATKAGIRSRGRAEYVHGKPYTSRLLRFIQAMKQTHFKYGSQYVSRANEPLYAWSTHLGLPIWHWVGKGWAAPGDRLHPLCRAAFKRILEQATVWEQGEDSENMPCPKERLGEFVEANFQAAGFFTKVLDIRDEL